MRQVGALESTYQNYKDIADFYIVYIHEAHAADGKRPTDFAKEKGITEPATFDQRCTVATRLIEEKKLTIPCLIDGMDNAVADAYHAHPDRVFLIRTDGKLGMAGNRGPRGFKPALDKVADWLAEYKKTGTEPPLAFGILEKPSKKRSNRRSSSAER